MQKVDETKESRGRADPVTATELPLNSRRCRVNTGKEKKRVGNKNERQAQKPIRVPKKRDQKKVG